LWANMPWSPSLWSPPACLTPYAHGKQGLMLGLLQSLILLSSCRCNACIVCGRKERCPLRVVGQWLLCFSSVCDQLRDLCDHSLSNSVGWLCPAPFLPNDLLFWNYEQGVT
jgi:hypothetical protein